MAIASLGTAPGSAPVALEFGTPHRGGACVVWSRAKGSANAALGVNSSGEWQ
jgi:hypothetical protein